VKIKVDYEGVRELEAALEGMDRKMRARTLFTAAKAGAEIMAERARELAPQDTGALAEKGIKVKVTKRSQFYGEAAYGHDQKHFYGMFQEVGVSPHPQPRAKRKHPGHVAQPHLRPAFDQKKGESEKAMHQHLHRALMAVIIRRMVT